MTPSSNPSQIVLYTTLDGTVKIDTIFQDETIWLTQKKMAELFDVNVPAISKHLSSIFKEGELQKEATIPKMETVQSSNKVVGFILEHTTQYSLLGTNCPPDKSGGFIK